MRRRAGTCVLVATLLVGGIGAYALLRRPVSFGVGTDDGVRVNPSLPVTIADAKRELITSENEPKVKLDRPLVICGGFLDVGFGPWLMRRTLERHVEGTIICVTFATRTDLPNCREHLVAAIDDALGSSSATETQEVDVIGQSLGGLIAVYSTLDDASLGKRVKVRRMFTICSPLQGATLATHTQHNWLDYQADLRPGSDTARRLADARLDYELISYARLRDGKVGEQYSFLPDHPGYWLDTPAGESAHDGADFDARILLDLVRRLRQEAPVGKQSPTTLPAR